MTCSACGTRLNAAMHIFGGRTTARWAYETLYHLHVRLCLHAAKTIVMFAEVVFGQMYKHARCSPTRGISLIDGFDGGDGDDDDDDDDADDDDVNDDVDDNVHVIVDDNAAGGEIIAKLSATNAQVDTAACLCLACSSN